MKTEPPFRTDYLDRLLSATNPSPLAAGDDVLVDRKILRAVIYMAGRALVYETELREDAEILSGYAKNHRDKIETIRSNREHTEEEREALIAATISKAETNENRCIEIRGLFNWPDTI